MIRTTRAAIASGQGHFAIESIEVASPQGDEVLVEIRASGLCHTDHASLDWKRPLVMGHEGAGVVLEVGPEVTGSVPEIGWCSIGSFPAAPVRPAIVGLRFIATAAGRPM